MSAAAQGLQPSAPTQEFIYFGGRLIAVEERGPGGNGSNAVKTPAKAGAASSADAVPVTSSGITPPPQPPQPVVPPQDTTGAAGRLAATPVSTHAASPVQQ